MEDRSQLKVPTALPTEKNTGDHLTGGWVGPIACLDVSVENNLSLLSGFELQSAHPVFFLHLAKYKFNQNILGTLS